MSAVQYMFGFVRFLLVWFLVAIVVGVAVTFFVPPANGEHVVLGIGLDWRNLPGTILGFFAGLQSYRASIRNK